MLENIITFATNNTSNVTKVLTAPAPGVSLLFAGAESFLFPFLLVFAIVYGVLQRSEDKEKSKPEFYGVGNIRRSYQA